MNQKIYSEKIEEPFFSIIIPLYNRELYILDCLESIRIQTFNSYEIIVVDDGSTDNGFKLCQEQKDKGCDIKLYKQENSGPYNARISGIEHAEGKYIVFLDSDDMIRKDALEGIYTAVCQNDADIVIFNGSKDSGYKVPFLKYPFSDGRVFESYSKFELYELICTSTLLNNLATKCISRELIHIEDLARIDHFINSEDLYFFIPCLDRAKKVVYLNQNYYYYRPNELSSTHNYNQYFYRSAKRTNLRCIEYSNKWGMGISSVMRRASHACVFSVVYTLNSKLSDVQCMNELNKIYRDNFFRECIVHKPIGATKRETLVYYVIRNAVFRKSKLMLKALRKLIKRD